MTTFGHGRVDDEPLDAGLVRAADGDRGVERAPQLAVGVPHLLHAGVVRVEVGDRPRGRTDPGRRSGTWRRRVVQAWPSGKSTGASGRTSVAWCTSRRSASRASGSRLGLAVLPATTCWSASRPGGRCCVPLPLASSAALEDMKNSVPPLAGEALPGGEVLGQTVKPGLPLSSPAVSIWVTATGPPRRGPPWRRRRPGRRGRVVGEERVLVRRDVEAVARRRRCAGSHRGTGRDRNRRCSAGSGGRACRRCRRPGPAAGRSSSCRSGSTCCSPPGRGGSCPRTPRSSRPGLEGEHDVEPALRVGVVEAGRVGHERTERSTGRLIAGG